MVICSRCQQPVDETARTTCPLCSTPLPTTGVASLNASVTPLGEAPLSEAANGIPGLRSTATPPTSLPMSGPTPAANQRMTLGGEIIEAPQPMSGAPGPGNSQYAARTSYSTPRTPPKAERASLDLKPIIIGLILLIVGGGGGWYYWMHRTDPKEQAQKFFTALKDQNFKSMYEMTETDVGKYKDEQDYTYKVGPMFTPDRVSGLQFQAGEPKYAGMTEATVPVAVTGSINITFLGQTKAQEVNVNTDVKMKNFGGIWKISKDNTLSESNLLGSGH